jgi:anti-sigma B factor antagonist
MEPPDELLTIRVRDDGADVIVDVAGEIDIVTSVRLNREQRDVLERVPPPPVVRVDLSAAPFMDTSGLAVLLGARRTAAERGCRFVVSSPSHAISRVLAVTGLEHLLLEER